MEKTEIINLATSMGFNLNYDKFDNVKGDSNKLKYLRFISQDESLDEKELRWIWYKDDSDAENILRGEYIAARLRRKKEIQEFLRY